MASEAELAALVAATQSTMGAVIKRPPMTEKLLTRPPFRFLHDVLMEILRTSGFFEGLFTEEELVRYRPRFPAPARGGPPALTRLARRPAELGEHQGKGPQDGVSPKGH